MLHLFAVLFADGGAALACFDARAQLRTRKLEISAGKSRDNTSRGEANIRTIIAIANALHHFADVRFAQAGIGAGVACFRAGIGRGDAFDRFPMIR